MRKPPDGYVWSAERLTQIQAPTRIDHAWPEIWSSVCRKLLNERKSSNGLSTNRSSKMRESCGINFTDPNDKELKETIQNAMKKLEIPMEAAMPCKLNTLRHRETCSESNNIQKSKHACIVEALGIYEKAFGKDHDDHIAEKGFNSSSSCTNLSLCLKQ